MASRPLASVASSTADRLNLTRPTAVLLPRGSSGEDVPPRWLGSAVPSTLRRRPFMGSSWSPPTRGSSRRKPTWPGWGTVLVMVSLTCGCWMLPRIQADLTPEGLCDVWIFTPFTNFGTNNTCGPNNLGLVLMAAALLSMDHFNTRNNTVIKELSDLVAADCTVQLAPMGYPPNNLSSVAPDGSIDDVTSSSSSMLSWAANSDTWGQVAARAFARLQQQQLQQLTATSTDGGNNSSNLTLPRPCAMAGSFDDIPNAQLSAMANAYQIPLVLTRNFFIRTTSALLNPYALQLYPSMLETYRLLVQALLDKGRDNYIAILYALTDTQVQQREVLTSILDTLDVEWQASPYTWSSQDAATGGPPTQRYQLNESLSDILKGGYRTIVVLTDLATRELPAIAQAAQNLSMTTGDYFWVLGGSMDISLLWTDDSATQDLLAGALYMLPAAIGDVDPLHDPFVQSWREQGADLAHRVNLANPMGSNQPGYQGPINESFFHEHDPLWGASFMYDSIMAIGIGACRAQQQQEEEKNSSLVSSAKHLLAMRSAEFNGASGKVRFGVKGDETLNGTRSPGTVIWGIINLLPPVHPGEPIQFYRPTEGWYPGQKQWVRLANFTYRDGRNVPPDLLRTTPNQNYLNPALRALGLSFMGLTWLLSLATVTWVFVNRQHQVLRAAQPIFLYVLAFGAWVESSTIIPLSFDESFGFTTQQLDRCCVAIPWLLILGHIVTYGALFTKLWRVNRVLQFARRQIEVRHVAWPMGIIFGAAIVVLVLWTVLDPVRWVRTETNEVTGDSIGRCRSDSTAAFASALVGLALIPTVLTAVMAWKTRDVDDKYAESWWIFVLVLVQLEVLLVAAPVVIILMDVSSNGRYFGFAFMVCLFPLSTLALMMTPKVRSFYGKDEEARKRGARAGVRVSGVKDRKDGVGEFGQDSPAHTPAVVSASQGTASTKTESTTTMPYSEAAAMKSSTASQNADESKEHTEPGPEDLPFT